MKLVSYIYKGKPSYGVVKDDKIIDLATRLPHADMVAFIAAGAQAEAQARRILAEEPGEVSYDAVTLLPVVPDPGKIICIGINYEDHRLDAGRDKTPEPMVFARFSESQVAHRASILRSPRASTQLDFEAELLVVMGQQTPRYTRREDALKHVFGYSCFNEACHRDYQRHSSQLTPGKNFEKTGSSGPWIVTADEIADPQALHMQMRLNGKVMQDASTADMIFKVDYLIEYITRWLPLNPGDLIVTGTCGGVGFKRNPPIFMQPGDIAEVEISQIGVLTNAIEDDSWAK
jgi:2-keto-4-pentenoate hydratase/2-oxohepta-3-ene-1,7-dioic acid hydratase in catechol pathway